MVMSADPKPSVVRRKPPAPESASSSASFRLFATTDAGLENVLAGELKSLGVKRPRIAERGVAFNGDTETVYRANLHLRTAYRVLLSLGEFNARDRESLYEGVRSIHWSDHLTSSQTLAVDAVSHRSALDHTQFVSRVVKDAIVDGFREREGKRPSVDPKTPDIRLNARILNDRCTLSFDTSGQRLHQRGYRSTIGFAAPLKENLAAGILLLSGYDGTAPLIDPMCGSGTLLVEGALIAKRIAPGLLGRSFGFMRHPSFDKRKFRDILKEARAKIIRNLEPAIIGADIDATALRATKNAACGAGVDDVIRVKRADFKELPEQRSGMLVTNPPYGERLGELQSLGDLYRDLGDTLKHRLKGMTAHVLTGSKFLAKNVGLRPCKRDILFNGPIECRLLHYEIY
jgi:putative N6-adenine-specific DNA methylase